MDDVTLAMSDDAMTEAVHLAKRISTIEGATLPINDARRLRDLVEMMARVIRTESERHPQTATLDDAARYLRALWPRGERMTFATYETGEAWLRWSSLQGPDEAVSVPCVENEAPSVTLARLVARLREMAVAERDAAEARARVLRAAIGSES